MNRTLGHGFPGVSSSLDAASLTCSAAIRVVLFSILAVLIPGGLRTLHKRVHDHRNSHTIPTANRMWSWEPRIFSRLRWSMRSRSILDAAHSKYRGRPFRLERGDTNLIVLPTSFIPELNKLPAGLLNSREYHSFSMIGHLTGLDVVRKSNQHVKMLLSRVSPALPELLPATTERINTAVTRLFPQDTETWTTVEPLNILVHCVSEGIALALFGSPICDNPELIRLCFEHTRNIFTVVFAMRFVPSCLQPILVWLVPAKWRLHQGWKDMERFVIPEVHRRSRDLTGNTSSDLISWMIKDGSTAIDADPVILTRLVGSVAAGGTYSTANFVSRVVSDLTANPDVLAAVRQEIRAKDAEVGGRAHWDFSTYARLDKLESVMKETSRLAPGSLLVYSRVLQGDASLEDGNIELKKGQFVTVSSHNRSIDPEVFPDPQTYKGLRFYNTDQMLNQAPPPFHSLDGDILSWGAGRWACPGRFIATIAAKVLLVKILDEYDFEFHRGKEPPNTVIHEFGFWHPSNKMRVKRRMVDY